MPQLFLKHAPLLPRARLLRDVLAEPKGAHRLTGGASLNGEVDGNDSRGPIGADEGMLDLGSMVGVGSGGGLFGDGLKARHLFGRQEAAVVLARAHLERTF